MGPASAGRAVQIPSETVRRPLWSPKDVVSRATWTRESACSRYVVLAKPGMVGLS
jgi:hypothetical protein